MQNLPSNCDEFLPEKFVQGQPPNVPHLCPIENYWATLKRAVYAGGYQAMSLVALKCRIWAKICEVDQQVIFDHFKMAKGPYVTFKWIDSFLFDFSLFYTLYELYLIDVHFIEQCAIVSTL